jgi:antitoxin HicB
MKTVREIKTIKPPYPYEAYTHVIRRLAEEEGGGYLITFPDLSGCMSDGETMAEAIENGRDAFLGWISLQAEMGRQIPEPGWEPEEPVPDVSGKLSSVSRSPSTQSSPSGRRRRGSALTPSSSPLSRKT